MVRSAMRSPRYRYMEGETGAAGREASRNASFLFGAEDPPGPEGHAARDENRDE